MDYAEACKLSRRCYYICLGICAALGIAWFILSALDISLLEVNPYPCSLYSLFGLYCPGCGGTRAINFLMHGQLLKSLFYHPVVPYTAILVVCYLVSHTLNIITKGKVKAMLFRPIYFYIMIGIIMVQCVIKNVLVLCANVHIIS